MECLCLSSYLSRSCDPSRYGHQGLACEVPNDISAAGLIRPRWRRWPTKWVGPQPEGFRSVAFTYVRRNQPRDESKAERQKECTILR